MHVVVVRDITNRGDGAKFFTVAHKGHYLYGRRVVITSVVDGQRVMVADEDIPNQRSMVHVSLLVPCRAHERGVIGVTRALGRQIFASRKRS